MVKIVSCEKIDNGNKFVFNFNPKLSPIDLLNEIELFLYDFFELNGFDYDIEEIDEEEIVILAWRC